MSTEFQLTETQKETIKLQIASGFPVKVIRATIINPETGKPISDPTYGRLKDTLKKLKREALEVSLLETLDLVKRLKLFNDPKVTLELLKRQEKINRLLQKQHHRNTLAEEITKAESKEAALNRLNSALIRQEINGYEADHIRQTLALKYGQEKDSLNNLVALINAEDIKMIDKMTEVNPQRTDESIEIITETPETFCDINQ